MVPPPSACWEGKKLEKAEGRGIEKSEGKKLEKASLRWAEGRGIDLLFYY